MGDGVKVVFPSPFGWGVSGGGKLCCAAFSSRICMIEHTGAVLMGKDHKRPQGATTMQKFRLLVLKSRQIIVLSVAAAAALDHDSN